MGQGGDSGEKHREAEEVHRPAGILLQLWCQGSLKASSPLLPMPPFSIYPSSLSEPRKGLMTCSGQDWNSPLRKEPSLKTGEMELAMVVRKLGSLQLGGIPPSMLCSGTTSIRGA